MKCCWRNICGIFVLCLQSVNVVTSSESNNAKLQIREILKSSGSGDDVLKNSMTAFKSLMKTGNPKYGIPVMDPLYIDKTFDINNNDIQLKGKFSAEIQNLSNYVINELHADMDLNTLINVTLNDVSMNGSYSLQGTYVNLFPLMGAGNHQFNFTCLNLVLKPTFIAKNGFLKMTDSGINIEEKNLEVFVNGLLEGKDVSDILAYFLRDFISSIFSRGTQLSKLLNTSIVNSFNIDGRGKTIYGLIEAVKSLAATF